MIDVDTARVPEQRKTLLICDERAITGRVLAEQLTASGSYLQVFSAVRDAAAVVDAFTAHPTDVVLIGIRRGAPNGVKAVDALLTEHPTAPVIVFGTAADTPMLVKSILRGAQGFMVWDIRQPARPPAICPRTAATAVPHPATAPKALTEAEQRVLRGMGLGLTNREIGRRLSLPETIVKTRSRRILGKLGARDRAHAVALGLRYGLLT